MRNWLVFYLVWVSRWNKVDGNLFTWRQRINKGRCPINNRIDMDSHSCRYNGLTEGMKPGKEGCQLQAKDIATS